jgi:PAS domain S-box-containing protein
MQETIKILLVDHDAVDRKAIRLALQQSGNGVQIAEADSAELAQDALSKESFDCVLLDLGSNEAEGLNLLRHSRSAGVKTPFIVLTGQGTQARTGEIMKAGASDCLTKSTTSLEHLWQTIRAAVRIQRAEQLDSAARDRERAARDTVATAQRNLTFLAEASIVLGESLDYNTTLAAVARLAVPKIADWCSIHIVDQEKERLIPIAVAHADPSKVALARQLQQDYPQDMSADTGIPQVVRSGKSELYPHIDEQTLVAAAKDERHLRILRNLGLVSAMIVPLIARGRALGTLAMVSAESGRHYSKDDLLLAEDLARRAGAAVDNAMLYRRAQQSLAAEEQTAALLNTLFRSSPTALAFLDLNFRYMRVNEALAAMNGLSSEAHIGRGFWEVAPDVWTSIRPHLEQVVFGGEPVVDVEISGETRALPGQTRYWLASCYPVRAAGDVLGIGLVSTEITQRKRRETELRLAKDAAEAVNQAKDHFLAMLSHELRTPLTPVLMTVQSMQREGNIPPQWRDDLELIRRNVELEARLIDDLLDLTRISKGKLQLELQLMDGHEIIRDAIQMCLAEAQEKQLWVQQELRAAVRHVRADATRLQQVFWNLIKNAVKFTPPGGTIRVLTRNDDSGRFVVDVSDTGMGIEQEQLEHIFDAFEQGGQTITRQFGGLGLGLAISKAIIDMHGGTLTVASDGRNRGATFTVALASVPFGDSDSSDDPAQGGAHHRSVRILMVDDHVDTSRALQRMLARRGYDVRTAHSVHAALAAADSASFDLLISDIGLPDGSGLDLMRQLLARRPIKGIALSGFGMEEDIRKSKEAGFREHLTKPINLAKLEAVIEEMIG